jgi:hypothetical protein
MRKSIMSIQELEAQLLTLDHNERLRLSQLLTQSLTTTPQSTPKPTVAEAIAQFHHNRSPEELDPNSSVASSRSMISFGMFSGSNQSTEADFKLAEFHGDLNDELHS